MKIITCVKQVRDLDMILKDDWVLDDTQQSVDLYYANKLLNPYDQTSVEIMLRLRDDQNIKTEVITIGDSSTDEVLRKCFSVGVDSGKRVDVKDSKFRTPRSTANYLKEAIDLDDVDLILCGKQADNGNHGQTGQILAKKLGWPCFTDILDIHFKESHFELTRLSENNIEKLTVKPPFVGVITQSGDKFLRLATLMDVLKAKSKEVEIINVPKNLTDKFYDVESVEVIKSNKSTEYILMSDSINKDFNQLLKSIQEGDEV